MRNNFVLFRKCKTHGGAQAHVSLEMSVSEEINECLDRTRDYSAHKDPLHEAIQRIEDRLSKIEFNQGSFRGRSATTKTSIRFPPPEVSFLPYQANIEQSSDLPHLANPFTLGPDSSAATAEGPIPKNIQEQFDCVKQTVDKVLLPPHLKLHESRTGIRRENQKTLNVISKCGRYVETCFKLLSQIKENEPSDLGPVYITLAAQINYLQKEYGSLVVNSNFDEPTANIFRCLQGNASGFDRETLNNIRVAAELSSIRRFDAPPRGRWRGRSFSGNPSYGSGRGNHYGRGRRDVFDQLQGARFKTPGNRQSDVEIE